MADSGKQEKHTISEVLIQHQRGREESDVGPTGGLRTEKKNQCKENNARTRTTGK